MKTCNSCHESKPENGFYVNTKNPYRLSAKCKDCMAAGRAERRNETRLHGPKVILIEKWCSRCKITKSVEEFTASLASKDGFASWCRQCGNIATLASSRKSHQQNPKLAKAREMLTRARARAKSLNLACDIDIDWLSENLPDTCPALGIPINYRNRDVLRDDSPSLDRYVPELGYTKDNCFVISDLANKIKNSATSKQVRNVAQWMSMINDVTLWISLDENV